MAKSPKGSDKTLSAQEAQPEKQVRSVPPWSVIVLSFLIGAGVVGAIIAALFNIGLFPASEEASTQVRSLAERVAQVEGLRSHINALENSVNRLETTRNSLASLQEKEESDVHRLESALHDIKGAAGQQPPADLAPLQARLAELEHTLATTTQVQLAEKERLIALALGSLALKEALDKGAPFAAELEFVRNLLHAGSDLSNLENYANSGVPTIGALLARYPETAKQMLRADMPEDAGFFGRTFAYLRSLVSVRPVGDVPGETSDAILARTEFRLQQGNSEDAWRVFQTLPDRARQAAPEWGKDLAARAGADRLMREIVLTAAQGLKPATLPNAR